MGEGAMWRNGIKKDHGRGNNVEEWVKKVP